MYRRLTICAAVVASIGGCATTQGGGSWVGKVNEGQARQVAEGMAGFVAQQLPPARTTLVLEPPAEGQGSNAVTSALGPALRQAGFAVADPKAEVSGAVRVRYLVTAMDDGVLVRLRLGDTEAARWYRPDAAGSLAAASPFTVREAGQ